MSECALSPSPPPPLSHTQFLKIPLFPRGKEEEEGTNTKVLPLSLFPSHCVQASELSSFVSLGEERKGKEEEVK